MALWGPIFVENCLHDNETIASDFMNNVYFHGGFEHHYQINMQSDC